MNKFKKYITVAGNIITILTLLFIVYTINNMQINISSIFKNKSLLVICIISICIFSLLIYLMAYAWKISLDFFSSNENQFCKMAKIYAKTNIGKYLPGNVMHYVERNLYAKRINIKPTNILLSSVIEISGVAFAAVIISILFARKNIALLFYNYLDKDVLIMWGSFILVCLMIFFGVVYKFKNKIQKTLKQLLHKRFIIDLIKIFFIYTVFLCVGGFIYAIIFFNFTNLPYEIIKLYVIVASYVLAWVIGFVIPGAPGGIGVREFVLVFLLGNFLGKSDVLTVALIHRLLTILGDVLAWLISFHPYFNNNKE